ncbi:hypothetical protein [Granulosicoccus antarcticus]|nr:hypothetical protein [Granulosicoccus antarcticus]
MQITPRRLGLTYCLGYVFLEAFQAVYLGSLFQQVDSFRLGAWVFGLSFLGCALLAGVLYPNELKTALRSRSIVVSLNIMVALTWCCYFLAVQLIEPAIVFTIFSGMVPLGTAFAQRKAIATSPMKNQRGEVIGLALILLAILFLALITLSGHSGFVRGGWATALAGVVLAVISGTATAYVILLSVKWHEQGASPVIQFGMRFMLYVPIALMAVQLGIDAKPEASIPMAFPALVLIGMVVIALPLFLMQKAISLVSASFIAALTALGPAMVFVLQLLDGRIAYAPATLAGLAIYIVGALLAVSGIDSDVGSVVPDAQVA